MSIRNFLERMEQHVVNVINGRHRGRLTAVFRLLLFALSRVHENVVQFRLYLYDIALFRQRDLGCFVVSVGNLTAGGTGKTPLVELLARRLSARGKKVAILSRGYRRKPPPLWNRLTAFFGGGLVSAPPLLVSDGVTVLAGSAEAGDEPYMLARNLLARDGCPGAMVVVDKDRYKCGTFATDRGAEIIILDDGFQHLRLSRWMNLLVVDSTNPFHNHEMLPYGMLREPIRNMRRANYIFLTKCSDPARVEHLRHFFQRNTPGVPVIVSHHAPCHLEDVCRAGVRVGLEVLRGQPIASICAIAVPKSFEDYLQELGGDLVYSVRFADHHRYSAEELAAFCQEAGRRGAAYLLTTEKDAVRLPRLPKEHLPFYFLRVEIRILSGEEHFQECLSRLCLG